MADEAITVEVEEGVGEGEVEDGVEVTVAGAVVAAMEGVLFNGSLRALTR